MKSLFLDALKGINEQKRPPVWLMRQAGRYMPQYRDIREKHSFLEMVHQPELVAEVTQLPIRSFGMDAAILFSDILMVAEALGVGLRFEDKVGPIIERPVRTPADISRLPHPHAAECFNFVAQGIKLMLPTLEVPLIGFAGGPFTVASYMIEGGSSRDLRLTKQWLLKDPHSFHQLLDRIAALTIDYLNMQIAAGVHALQLFDSWANFLNAYQFREFSLAYLDRILKGLSNPHLPVIIFCRGSSVFAPQIAEIKPAAISLDWNADIAQMRKAIPKTIALQGNLDPDVLCAPRHIVENETRRLLNAMKGEPGYIFNLGHGIVPEVPYDNVRALVDTIRAY